MYALNVIVLILLIIGGLNWGLVGLAHYNVVDSIFRHVPVIARIIYILVGLAGIYAIVFFNHYVRCSEWHAHEEHMEHRPHAHA